MSVSAIAALGSLVTAYGRAGVDEGTIDGFCAPRFDSPTSGGLPTVGRGVLPVAPIDTVTHQALYCRAIDTVHRSQADVVGEVVAFMPPAVIIRRPAPPVRWFGWAGSDASARVPSALTMPVTTMRWSFREGPVFRVRNRVPFTSRHR